MANTINPDERRRIVNAILGLHNQPRTLHEINGVYSNFKIIFIIFFSINFFNFFHFISAEYLLHTGARIAPTQEEARRSLMLMGDVQEVRARVHGWWVYAYKTTSQRSAHLR